MCELTDALTIAVYATLKFSQILNSFDFHHGLSKAKVQIAVTTLPLTSRSRQLINSTNFVCLDVWNQQGPQINDDPD